MASANTSGRSDCHLYRYEMDFFRKTNRLQVRTKLLIVFLLISLSSVTAVALVVNRQTSVILTKEVGADLKNHANMQGIAVGNLLQQQIELLQSLSLNEILINKANLANSLYDNDPAAAQARIVGMDKAWETAVETDRIAQIVLTNSAADELQAFRSRFPDHREIFITDRHGDLLAATNLISDYYQADEPWWQNAYDEGNGRAIIQPPQFNESVQTYRLALAVPVYDRDGQTVIGILRTTYSLHTLGNLLYSPIPENHPPLLDMVFPGNQIISPAAFLQNKPETANEPIVLNEITLHNLQTETSARITLGDADYLASLAPITTIDHKPLIDDLGWRIIARQERDTALALVASQQRTIWLLAVLIMLFTGIIAQFATQYLTNPILRLTDAAQQIRDGRLDIQAPVLTNDEIGELAATFNDMTDRLRHVIARLEEHGEALEKRVAERTTELEQQKNMMDVILSTTPTYFFVFDRSNQYIYASPPTLDAMGLTLAGLKTCSQEEPPSFIPKRMNEELNRVLQTGRPAANEFQISFAQQTKQFEYALNPVYDNEDREEVTAVVITIRDVTEQKLAQEALWRSQKMESLGILAGGVAHDFNNLLVALLGQTSLALRKLPPDSPAQKHVAKAMKAAERAADLTKQMLAYSGKGHFTMQPIRLNRLIQENSHLLEAVIPKKVQLRLDLANNLPLIDGDPGQLQQIVMNLILNAAEAIGDKDGLVMVTTRIKAITDNDERYWEKTGAPLTPGEYVCLQVHDDGAGMDEATLAKIFDPFFTTKFTGRGLGLAAVLGIVRGHEGGLAVSSQPDAGTTFELLFPAIREEEEVEEEEETAVSNRQPIANALLVIDDEAPVREATVDILEMENIPVLTAANGEAGISLYQEQRETIDLILLDLSMPGLSGYETFHALKQIDPDVKIILSSGYSEEEVYRQFSEENVTDFLSKPYQLTTLIQKVQQYLV